MKNKHSKTLENCEIATLTQIFKGVCRESVRDEYGNEIGTIKVKQEFENDLGRIIPLVLPTIHSSAAVTSHLMIEGSAELLDQFKEFNRLVARMRSSVRKIYGRMFELEKPNLRVRTVTEDPELAMNGRLLRAPNLSKNDLEARRFLDEREAIVFAFLTIGTILEFQSKTTTRSLFYTEAANFVCRFYLAVEKAFSDFKSPYSQNVDSPDESDVAMRDNSAAIVKRVQRFLDKDPFPKPALDRLLSYGKPLGLSSLFKWYLDSRRANKTHASINRTVVRKKK